MSATSTLPENCHAIVELFGHQRIAARLLYTLCCLALFGVVAIALVGYGESRAAHQCLAMVTAPYGQQYNRLPAQLADRPQAHAQLTDHAPALRHPLRPGPQQ